MEEAWVAICGYPNYVVNNYGDVINVITDKKLRPTPTPDGYLKVALSNEDGVRFYYIHQLVAKAFFDSFREGVQVRHVNGDNNDNRTVNLVLRGGVKTTTDRELGEGWGKRVQIVETGEVFRTVRDCARYIGGDYSGIYACLRGERKQHLGYSFEYFEED